MISKDTYEEVYEILQCIDKSTVDKIPQKILKEIQENRNIYYKTKIDKKDIFNEKNVNEETIDFLCYLDYNYWMNNAKKGKIDKINYKKFIIEEKRKKYNPEDIFKQHKEKYEKEDTSLVEVNETTALEKIKKIMKKLRKIFWGKGRLLRLRIILFI